MCIRAASLPHILFTSSESVSSKDWSNHLCDSEWHLPYTRSIDTVHFYYYYTVIYVDVERFHKSYWFFICCIRMSLITYIYVEPYPGVLPFFFFFFHCSPFIELECLCRDFFCCESQQFYGVMDDQLPSIPFSYKLSF